MPQALPLRPLSGRLSVLLTILAVCLQLAIPMTLNAKPADKPHAVFVVGTNHYSPGTTMPGLAAQLDQLGFRTTVVSASYNPEKNAKGLPGLEALKDADVAIFYARFLTLPTDQLKLIEDYLKSGKPVVGFRTSTHAFAYKASDPKAKWNDGFGRDALGTKYFIHLKGSTQVNESPGAKGHPILTGADFSKVRTASGTLYLATLPKDAKPLLQGTGKSSRTGKVTNSFGTHELAATMTHDVAWTWTNGWGGRVFATTLGHPGSFKDPHFVRLFINGIHWAVGVDVPAADAKIAKFKAVKAKPSDKEQVAAKAKPKGTTKPKPKRTKKPKPASKDAKNRPTGKPVPTRDPELAKYAIYAKSAPRAQATKPIKTTLPLKLNKGDRIAFIGNTLLERAHHFGYIEALLHQRYPKHELIVRNLCWPADTPDLQPRPSNFADTEQHLRHERADVIFASFGFNESFAGEPGIPAFLASLKKYIGGLQAKKFNGKSAPRIVLVSPMPNENVKGVAAADDNNANIKRYADAVKQVANELGVGFADVYSTTLGTLGDTSNSLTFNGCHLTAQGYGVFAAALYKQVIGEDAPVARADLRQVIVDKNRQYFRRFRPLNTFYYTGGRSGSYGYLDFLPAMRSFDAMVANREQRIWALARGEKITGKVDDSNVPPMPNTKQSRGANRWITAKEELKEFKIDPRFEVNLFAGEEEFPDIAAPIQMRWDAKGRLWVSCSTTYPHVYPGKEPNDKLVILEDTDGDGKADKSTVFADDLHIPLSFEFGDGGVYVSEMPHLTFIKDTDGDGKADMRRIVMTGFGTEDSHHSLHDFAWTPDGDLIFRESIFHHTQVETPYGPVRQANSGWFRYEPRTHRLTSFGTYHSTNPWGVTFDDWGQHMASHPVLASAFHALDPPYPKQHAKPSGLQAYSGTCGQEFIDFKTFPKDMQGGFFKVRYKPTNRVEYHRWVENEFGFEEKYVGDIIFSSNLSFIPVDLRFGPRGAMYVCDWYNPIKGHAQYSLRDERRDRHSGRIWRITTKGIKLQAPPKIAGQPIPALLELLKRPEYRYRYWVKRELRARNVSEVKAALDKWVVGLDANDPRHRHHQIEAIWTYRNIDAVNTKLLIEVLGCDVHHARAAATRQLRYWHSYLPDPIAVLRKSANDPNGLVRMEAAIAASYIGTKAALQAMLDVVKYPREKHLAYAITTSLNSHTLRRHWENDPSFNIAQILNNSKQQSALKEPSLTATEAQFDLQKNLKAVRIGCVPEQMTYTVTQFAVTTGQPVKIVFVNPDATDHNLVVVKPGALEEVGMAANEMARDPKNANSDFIPKAKKHLIVVNSPMIGPTRKSQVHVLRFNAPSEPGIYPFVCTFPGHWVMMKGEIVVAKNPKDVKGMLAARKQPSFVKNWTVADLAKDTENLKGRSIMRGMKAFMNAKCNLCHVVDGHGTNLGPDLTKISEKYRGAKLLEQIIEPSKEINEEFKTYQITKKNGDVIMGVIRKEDKRAYHVIANLLDPTTVTVLPKRLVKSKKQLPISSMPPGLVVVLTKEEILDLLAYLEAGGYKLPAGLKHGGHKHGHGDKK